MARQPQRVGAELAGARQGQVIGVEAEPVQVEQHAGGDEGVLVEMAAQGLGADAGGVQELRGAQGVGAHHHGAGAECGLGAVGDAAQTGPGDPAGVLVEGGHEGAGEQGEGGIAARGECREDRPGCRAGHGARRGGGDGHGHGLRGPVGGPAPP